MICREGMTPRQKFDLSQLPQRPNLAFERALWGQGMKVVVGIDEAGRGALVGPVGVGAVVLPSDMPELEERLSGVCDSKVMSPEAREKWAMVIKQIALAWGVGFASAREIDSIGIVAATYRAAARAMLKLNCTLEHVLVDFLTLPGLDTAQTALIKGDARSLTIASASILAKTARDALLVAMDQDFPDYHLASNKGYATQEHLAAIAAFGPCEEHRFTFSPIAEYGSLFPPDLKQQG
jgi:ribonuclease HII